MSIISSFPSAMMLIFSIWMALSSSHWISLWMGLVINLVSMTMLMSLHNQNSETTMMYFLVQAMTSSSILLSGLIQYLTSLYILPTLLFMMISLKIGFVPIHSWVITVYSKSSWTILFILMTAQKIIPVWMLSILISKISLMILIFLASSAIISSASMINSASIKIFLAYSSITHSSWMGMASMLSISLLTNYLVLYSILMMLICYCLKKLSWMKIFQTSKLMYPFTLMFIMLMFSTSGLPPFMGFIPKMLIIQMTSTYPFKILILMFAMLMSSALSLFGYFKLISKLSVQMLIHLKQTFQPNLLLSILFTMNLLVIFILIPLYW